jgi:aminocarboxymuconate-semialdehyde decarboxylase
MLIDHQSHWYPGSAWKRLEQRSDYPRASRRGATWVLETAPGEAMPYALGGIELEVQLQDMDAHGVDAIVCSTAGTPGIGDVTMLEPSEAMDMTQLVNHEMAAAQREHPDRLIGLCVLPLQDTERALVVLDEAILELGLKGVSIHANINGQPIVSDATEPVFARIAELGVPAVLHPTLRTAMSGAYARFGAMFELTTWMFDTSAAALSLIVGGVLDRHEALRILHPHLGGTLPFLAGRMAGLDRTIGNGAAHDTATYLRTRFHVDTVMTTPGALGLAAAAYGPERIVFASDYPWVPRRVAFEHLRSDADAETAGRILSENRVPGLSPAGAVD